MAKIAKILAREILDSRGNPAVEADVVLDNGVIGRAAVPSGASTGEHEAVELRDGDSRRYGGKGVSRAVGNVSGIIAREITGFAGGRQKELDHKLCELDGSKDKSRLGANAILAVSMAYARATASEQKIPLYQHIGSLAGHAPHILPVPMMNILNGGAHADNSIDIQEFMIVPVGFDRFSEALRAGAEIFHTLKKVLKGMKMNTSVGDEGGFAPNLSSANEALEAICEAVETAGYKAGGDVGLALDAAASEFYREGKYQFESGAREAPAMISFYEELVKKFPILSLEDGLAENDWEGWKLMTDKLGSKIQLVGDDIFVTNTERLQTGLSKKIANSILIKLNQIGTLSETLETIQMAQKAAYTAVISHRSGETEDTAIADLAVGTGAGQIKTGSLCRTDRVCKYNQLIRIEEELGNHAIYPGRQVFKF